METKINRPFSEGYMKVVRNMECSRNPEELHTARTLMDLFTMRKDTDSREKQKILLTFETHASRVGYWEWYNG